MEEQYERAVLLADITGSTALYESVGDGVAASRIFRCIDFMREAIEKNGGVFVAAKGDDVLATFTDCDAALQAARTMLESLPDADLSIHAGLHYGMVVASRGDIFGDTVNLTARLASTANPGEVLASADFAARLAPAGAAMLHELNTIAFKGKSQPIAVHSLSLERARPGVQATMVELFVAQQERISVTITFGADVFTVADGQNLSLGRADENDIVIPQGWVSRRHGTVTVADGRAQFIDSSSYGSYLQMTGGSEVSLHREATLLTGSGRISPGMSFSQPKAVVLEFQVETVASPQHGTRLAGSPA